MANDLYLVFATPTEKVDETEFNEFENRQVADVLESPGFVAARRFALLNPRGEGFPSSHRYMTMYEVNLPFEQIQEGLLRLASDRGRPEWYPREVSIQSVSASSLDGHPDPTATEHGYLVFTGTPTSLTFDEYDAWNATHQKNNLEATRLLERGYRFRLSSSPGVDSPTPDYFEAYSLAGPRQQMLDEVHAASAAAGRSHPDGFRHFASFEAKAITD